MKRIAPHLLVVAILLLGIGAIVSGLWLSEAAGRGSVSGNSMVFLYFTLRWLPALGGLVGLATTILIPRLRVRFWQGAVFLSAALALGADMMVLTTERRDTVFLKSFKQHVTTQIGEDSLRQFGGNVRDEVNTGKVRPSRLRPSDYPMSWQALFPSTSVDGFIVYGEGDKCRKLVVCWGGHLLRWGLQFTFDGEPMSSPPEKRSVVSVTADIECFIEK